MKSVLLIAVIPAIIIGVINGFYWKKQGYSQLQYTILGAFIAYALLVKAIDFFWGR